MKKIYYMLLLAVVSLAMNSCSDWDSPYYIDDLVGSWESEFGQDFYGTYDIRGYDVVRYDFYSNHTGRYTYYSAYGLDYVDFDWDTHGNHLNIRYYDGDYESLYYGFDDLGYLILSTDYYFHQYTAYRPSSPYYYSTGKEMVGANGGRKLAPGKDTGEVTGKDTGEVKVKSVSRAIKARVTDGE